MKSGNLNFLEPSGTLQACNGTSALTSWNPLDHSRPGTGLVTFSLKTELNVGLKMEDKFLREYRAGKTYFL